MKHIWKKSRFWTILLAIAVLFSAISVPASASGFYDIKADNPNLDAINYVSDNKYMVGTGEGNFSPGNDVTRAMTAAILHRMAGSPEPEYDVTFSDVPSSAYYAKAVKWGASVGIISGTPGGTFSPNKVVTRQEMACFLFRYANEGITSVAVNKPGSIEGCPDTNQVGAFAKAAMEWAIGNGVLKKKSGRLLPTTAMTRADMADAVTKFGTNVERLANSRDYFSFWNEDNESSNIFFSQKYHISENHKRKITNKIRTKYQNDPNRANTVIQSVNGFLDSDPVGRCFGMSAVTILDKYGKIAFNEIFDASSTMNDVTCSPESGTESAITYYHVSQEIPGIYTPEQTRIGDALNKMRNASGPSMFIITVIDLTESSLAHAVIVNSCVYNGSNYVLELYEPNMGWTTTWTVYAQSGRYYISSSDKFDGYHFLYAYAITDFSVFNFLDIDGHQNSATVANNPLSVSDPVEIAADFELGAETDTVLQPDPDNYSTIYFQLQDGVTITNDKGENLTWKDEQFSGDMEIYRWNFIAGTRPALVYFDVPASETFQIDIPENGTQTFEVVDNYRFQSVEGITGTACLHSSGAIELTGNLEDFQVKSFRPGDTGTQTLSGAGSESVKIVFADGRLNASGMKGNYTVSWTDETGTTQTAEIAAAPAETEVTSAESSEGGIVSAEIE